MPFTTLTRSIVRAFLANLALVAGFLLIIIGVVDTLAHLEMLTTHRDGVWRSLWAWNAWRLPEFGAELLPLGLLGAAMMTVTHIVRGNELIACLCAGISARRVMRPLWVLALLAALVLYLWAQWGLPTARAALYERELTRDQSANRFHLWARDHQGRLAFCELYNRPERRVQQLWLQEYDDAMRLRRLTLVDEALWRDRPIRGWWVIAGRELEYDEQGRRTNGIRPLANTWLLSTSLKPPDLSVSRHDADQALSAIIEDATQRGAPRQSQLLMHQKLSDPWRGALLVMLAVPVLLSRRQRSFFWSGVTCIVIAGLFFGVTLTCLALGGKGTLPPWAAAWGPLLGFGAIALWRWRRMPT